MQEENKKFYNPEDELPKKEPYKMTKQEGRWYIQGALKAGLLVALVYGLGYFFVILFMDLYLNRG